MTDPITIPCHPAIGINGWTFTIDADLARRIVALAQADVPSVVGCAVNLISSRICQRGQKGCTIDHDATPVADDDAAVTALCNAYRDVPLNSQGLAPLRQQMENLIAAIKAGKVPGVYACKSDAEMGRYHVAYCEQMKQERDKALAELALANEACTEKQAAIEKFMIDEQEHGREMRLIEAANASLRADLAAETDAKHRALTCAADYAEEAAKLKADLAACRACDDQHVRDLEACHKVQEELRAELAAEKERAEKAEAQRAQQVKMYVAAAASRDALTAQRDRLAGLLRTAKQDANIAAALAELERKP